MQTTLAVQQQLRPSVPCAFRTSNARRTPRAAAVSPRAAAKPVAKGRPAARNVVEVEDPELNVPAELGAAVMRVTMGVFMIHNGLDKLADPEGFAKFVVEPYLHLPFPLQATYFAAYSQLIGSAGLITGFQTRLSAAAIGGTMGGALIFHLSSTGLEGFPFAVVKAHQYGFETCVLYGIISLYFLLAGGGAYSVDALLESKKEDDE